MDSPKICSSPSYKNLKTKQTQSPIELKEKMRKVISCYILNNNKCKIFFLSITLYRLGLQE